MEKAFASNQVKEDAKVDILKKHLKGEARDLLVRTEFENYQEALKSLHTHFKGHKQRIWSKLLDDYEAKAKHVPDRWPKATPEEKKKMMSRTCALLEEAEGLAKRDPELAEKVYSDKTVEALVRWNPKEIKDKIIHKSKKKKKQLKVDSLTHKQNVSLMKDIFQDYLEDAIEATCPAYGDALKDDVKTTNTINQSWRERKEREKKDHQNLDNKNCLACQSSNRCNTKWGGLGCIELYRIHETKERSEFLYIKRLCPKCGQKDYTHDFVDGKKLCQPLFLRAALPARCKGLYNGKNCLFGAALCENTNHLPNTATRELLDWIKRNNIRTTVTSIYKTISTKKNYNHPSTTDLSKNARTKLQLGKESAP